MHFKMRQRLSVFAALAGNAVLFFFAKVSAKADCDVEIDGTVYDFSWLKGQTFRTTGSGLSAYRYYLNVCENMNTPTCDVSSAQIYFLRSRSKARLY